MDKIKEKELDLLIRDRSLTTEEAVNILGQEDYLGDYDQDIEKLDIALAEAYMAGEIKDLYDVDEIANFFLKKGLVKDQPYPLNQLLCIRLVERALNGHSAWTKTQEGDLLERATKKIGQILNEGGDYQKVFTSVVYKDSPVHNLAFLNHIEGRFKTSVLSPAQLSSLADLVGEPRDDVENCFFMALEHRYELALEEILKRGGSFAELMAVDPRTFNLPDQWDGMDKDTNKEKMIDKAIFFFFSMSEIASLRPRLRDIADELGAPYERILKIFSERVI